MKRLIETLRPLTDSSFEVMLGDQPEDATEAHASMV
jgi:hypothetical protein